MKKLLLIVAFFSSTLGFSQTLNALDPTFGNAGIVTIEGTGSSPSGIKFLDDGKILILAKINNLVKLIRLMPDGSIDNSYNSQLVSIPGNSESMIMLPDGKILVEITGNTNVLVKFDIDGTVDTSFGVNGYLMNCFQSSVYSLSYDAESGVINFFWPVAHWYSTVVCIP